MDKTKRRSYSCYFGVRNLLGALFRILLHKNRGHFYAKWHFILISAFLLLPFFAFFWFSSHSESPQSAFFKNFLEHPSAKLRFFKNPPSQNATMVLFLGQQKLRVMDYRHLSSQPYFSAMIQVLQNQKRFRSGSSHQLIHSNMPGPLGKGDTQGSGFFVQHGNLSWVLSNQHVFRHLSPQLLRHAFFDLQHDLAALATSNIDNETSLAQKHLVLSPLSHEEIDGRVVRIRTLTNAGFIEVIGRAMYLNASRNRMLQAYPEGTEGFLLKVNTPFEAHLFLDAMRGGSGSPVIDLATGDVLGVVTASGFNVLGKKKSCFLLFTGIRPLRDLLDLAVVESLRM